MLQGDRDWWRLSETIADEDRDAVVAHNAVALPEHQLDLSLAPIPCLGAIMTAPIVLLLSHPAVDEGSTAHDYTFQRAGWPLSALHAEAPAALGDWWRSRVAELSTVFGVQHVANSVAALFLTPWRGVAFADRLRLPSRRRMLDLAATAAARDALLIVLRHEELWTEDSDVASLPPTRRIHPRSWRVTELSRRNLGEDAWTAVCRRVQIHAWL